jgi:signal peptidase
LAAIDTQVVEQLEQQQEPKKRGLSPEHRKILKHIGDGAFILLLILMGLMVLSLIQSRRTGEPPRMFGQQTYIVLSGSMYPAFDAGSMIFVQPVAPETLAVGDIITYKNLSGDGSTTTHRIVEVVHEGGLRFVTRGDANAVNDPEPIAAHRVVGRVTRAIPYAGFVMDFARTKQGLLLIVVFPCALFIVGEIKKLYHYAVELDREAEAKKKAESESGA